MSMQRAALRGSAIYGFGMLVSRLASFILLPVYTHYLSPADYGVLELLDITSFTASILLSIRIAESLFYFYQRAESESERAAVASTCLMCGALTGLLAFAVGIPLAAPLSGLILGTHAFAPAFRITFATLALNLPLEITLNFMRAVDRPLAYVIVSTTRLLLAIALNILLVVGLGAGLYGILNSGVIATGAVVLVTGAWVLRQTGFAFRAQALWLQIRYAAPLAVGGIGLLFINFGDRYFLKHYVSLAEIGIYSLAYKLGMLVSYIQTPLDTYWRSQMYVLVQGESGDRRYVRMCTYQSVLLIYVALGIAVFIRPVVAVMATPAFAAAAPLAAGLVLVYLIRSIASYFRCAFFLENVTAKDARVVWLSAAVCVGGYALLIPRFGTWGAVSATGAAFSVMFVASLHQAQKVRRFEFEYKRLATAFAVAAILFGIHSLLDTRHLPAQIVSAVAAVALYPAVLYSVGFFDNGERRAFRELASAASAGVRRLSRRELYVYEAAGK